ncbi:APC family permease [Salinibacterium sp.]|uniref:APC family permease n=1 Tax=Salinibacterium sp. TaxID=1915057 RepID=UPI00286AEBF8|nr:APC family permease [Salinibacterium sp.]
MDELSGRALSVAAEASGAKATAVPAEEQKYAQELARSLSLRENILITLSAVTPASSVFIIMPSVISGVGGASAVAFVIAALVGLVVAFCYAELSSAFPISGGEYAFVARALGKPFGFALFLLSLVGGVFVLGVIASGAGTYLGELWGALSGGWVGIVVILVTAVIGCFPIKANAWVTGIFLVIEVGALVVLTLLGFVNVSQPVSTLWQATTAGPGGIVVAASAGLVVSFVATALFSYNGYGTAVYYSEETKFARKTIGRAILWSLAITVAAELIPLIAVLLGTPSMKGLLGADNPISYFITARGGSALNTIVSLGIAIAIINAVLAIVLQVARLLYSSARDRSWPDWISTPLGSVHPRLRTPVVATVVVGVVGALLLWLVPFDVLLVATGANLLVTYLLVALAALAGRMNGKTRRAEFRMPWWPITPIAMIIITLGVTAESVLQDWVPVSVTLAIFLVGFPYYFLYLRPRRDRWTLPEPADEELTDESHPHRATTHTPTQEEEVAP